MSNWQGFQKESMKYMSYDSLSRWQKVWFWLYRYPRAWLQYVWYEFTS